MTFVNILYYEKENGRSPFLIWFHSFDEQRKAVIATYLLKLGSLESNKHIKYIGDKIHELKIPIGPGFRIYFSILPQDLILILIAGDKSSQKRDILLARKFRRNHDWKK